MTGMMCAMLGSGGGFLETVVNGYTYTSVGKGNYTEVYGYDNVYFASTLTGSLSVANFPVTSSAIKSLCYFYDSSSGSSTINFVVTGTQSNSGWSTLTVDGTTYNRSSAGFTAGTYTVWSWTAIANHFSGVVSTVTIS